MYLAVHLSAQMCVPVDNLYPHIMLHKQKAPGGKSIGVASTQCLQCSWALPTDLKHNEASFLTNLCLCVSQMGQDIKIWQFWC